MKDMSEKPIECSECKRPTKVIYKEMVNGNINYTEMCTDCPVLQEKLHGERPSQAPNPLSCKMCGTSLESIILGQPVGCAECYMVFEDFLIHDLMAIDAIPPALQKKLAKEKVQMLHTGKSPHFSSDAELSSKLLSLNEALNEALKRENYEQAAFLRDQIKTLTKLST